MKQLLFALSVLILVSCSKENLQTEETGITKTGNITLKGRNEYAGSQYDHLSAYVRLLVKKYDRNDPGQFSVLWDTTIIERPVRQYPFLVNEEIKIKKQFGGIDDVTEVVKISYSVNYISDHQPAGNVGRVFGFDTGNKVLTIPIRI